MEQCRLFQLHVGFLAIVTDCRGNFTKAFNSTLQWDWLHCGCHLIHNVVKAGLDSLKHHAANPAQTMVALLQALDRLVVLSFHCIVTQVICVLCQKNMSAMCSIPACSLCMYIFGKAHGLVHPTLLSHIDFHVPIFCFLKFGLFWNRAKAFVAHVRKSTQATEELCNLQK